MKYDYSRSLNDSNINVACYLELEKDSFSAMFKSSYLFLLSVVLNSHKANDSVAKNRRK